PCKNRNRRCFPRFPAAYFHSGAWPLAEKQIFRRFDKSQTGLASSSCFAVFPLRDSRAYQSARCPIGDLPGLSPLKPPDVLEYEQHLHAKTQGQSLREPFDSLFRKLPLQRRQRLTQQFDPMAALELRLVAESIGLPLRPLLQRQLQRRFERGLELLEAWKRGLEKFGNALLRALRIRAPRQDRPQRLVHYRLNQSSLAREIAIGGGTGNARGLRDLADGRGHAGLHEPACRRKHKTPRPGAGASLCLFGQLELLT